MSTTVRGFLVRIMPCGKGDVSMPEKLRRRKDALECATTSEPASFWRRRLEGLVAFDAMRPQPAVRAVKDPQATVTLSPGAGCLPGNRPLCLDHELALRLRLNPRRISTVRQVDISGPP